MGLDDLSTPALEKYRSKANIIPPIGSAEFGALLRQQGILKRSNGAVVPTGFGFLLFGERPRNAVPHAGVLARDRMRGEDDVTKRVAPHHRFGGGELKYRAYIRTLYDLQARHVIAFSK